MAVSNVGYRKHRQRFYSLSKDKKTENVYNGDWCIEIDTGDEYLFDQENDEWVRQEGTLQGIVDKLDDVQDGSLQGIIDKLQNVQDETLQSIIDKLHDVIKMQFVCSSVEQTSQQFTKDPTEVTTHNLPEGATQLELYVESGYVRVRTDGEACTSDTGEPIAPGFGAGWMAPSISVFPVQESVYTVVSR